MIFCVLADTTAKLRAYIDDKAVPIFFLPEGTRSPSELVDFVKSIPVSDIVICTHSMFLVRELEMSGKPVTWVNITEQGVLSSTDIGEIGNIAALEEDLKQSTRYLEFV